MLPHSLLSRCPESLVVQGVAKSRVIVETGVQTVGGVGGDVEEEVANFMPDVKATAKAPR